MKILVYVLKNIVNGKTYVGITKNIQERWYCHRYEARTGNKNPLYRAIRKYGEENFKLKIIGIYTKKKACQIERSLIAELKSTKRANGYNIDLGGVAAGKHSKETKAKIGIASARRKHSQETKNLLSKLHRGRKRTALTKRRNAAATRRQWADPIIRQSMIEGLKKGAAKRWEGYVKKND